MIGCERLVDLGSGLGVVIDLLEGSGEDVLFPQDAWI
jgi:hypothetical protein